MHKVIFRFFLPSILNAELATETTLEDVIQTTTHMSAENVVVTVSIPANVAETHVINISIIPRANRPVEVRTERIAVNYQNQSGDEVGLQPQMSRLDLNEEPQTPGRRNTTVSFDTPTSTGRSHSARTPANTPASLTGVRSPQWAAAVDVSDDDTEVDELMPVYPPLHGQREVAHRDQHDGRRYYVLTKGKKIGVFYCTW